MRFLIRSIRQFRRAGAASASAKPGASAAGPAPRLRLLALTVLALAARAHAAPILFPATPTTPAQWRDERDVAPFEAALKAAALRREMSPRAAATSNQLAHDA